MNQDILSQDEVDALLRGMTGESAETENASPADQATVREYNLASQERIVRGRMPTLEIINERFSRNLRVGLFNLIRRTPEVSVGPVEVQKYSAFLRKLVVPANFNIMSVQPLRGSGLVVCDPTLVFAVIDALFGGQGKFRTRIEGREFSATEMRVIQRMVDVIQTEYKKAWEGVYPLELLYQRSEMQPQFANIAAPGEIIVSTTFKLEVGDFAGDINICVPYATLEPIRDVLFSNTHSNAPGDQRWVNLLKHQIQDAEVVITAELGRAQSNVAGLIELKKGDFIELSIDPQVTAKVDGVPVFKCDYGVSNNHYALKIVELLMSSNLSWIGKPHV